MPHKITPKQRAAMNAGQARRKAKRLGSIPLDTLNKKVDELIKNPPIMDEEWVGVETITNMEEEK